jgi:hypothetical protein
MEKKNIVQIHVKHTGKEPIIRKEVELKSEPCSAYIALLLDEFELSDWDYEIDYQSGAVLQEYQMPKKCKVESIYATIETRYYKEV